MLNHGSESSLERAGLKRHISLEDGQKQFRLNVAGIQAPEPTGQALPQEIVLVEAYEPSVAAQKVASQISQELEEFSIRISRFPWGSDVSQLNGKSCIVLTDLEKALLLQASSEDFHAVQQMILQAESLLWVSGNLGPEAHLVSGLARSVRNEVAGINFRTLQVSGTSLESAHEFASIVLRVFRSLVADEEFVSVGGIVTVSRFSEDRRRNETLATMIGKRESNVDMMPLEAAPGAVRLAIRNPGMLDSLCFEPDAAAETPLGSDEVEVQVKASGVKYVLISFPFRSPDVW